MTPIGFLSSPYREKFGVPRQPGLAESARSTLRLDPTFREAVRGLDEFSHVWLIFVFHLAIDEGWRPLVRPPRLGGQTARGVFATRSPHRPNPIGLSAVRLVAIRELDDGGIELELGGADLVDGTPILDIKPYVPYADAIADARGAWAEGPLPSLEVHFAAELDATLETVLARHPDFRALVEETLRLDPRPAFHREENRRDGQPKAERYAVRLHAYDVHWRYAPGKCTVERIAIVEDDATS